MEKYLLANVKKKGLQKRAKRQSKKVKVDEGEADDAQQQSEPETDTRRRSTRRTSASKKLTSEDMSATSFVPPTLASIESSSGTGQKSSTSQSNPKLTPLGKSTQSLQQGDKTPSGDDVAFPTMRKKICKKLFQALSESYGYEKSLSQSLALCIERRVRHTHFDMGAEYRRIVKNIFVAVKVTAILYLK